MSPPKSAKSSTLCDLLPPDSLSFESAMTALEQLIQSVEANRFSLDETLATYQRGQQLIARCNTLLKDAEQRLQQYDGVQCQDPILPERT